MNAHLLSGPGASTYAPTRRSSAWATSPIGTPGATGAWSPTSAVCPGRRLSVLGNHDRDVEALREAGFTSPGSPGAVRSGPAAGAEPRAARPAACRPARSTCTAAFTREPSRPRGTSTSRSSRPATSRSGSARCWPRRGGAGGGDDGPHGSSARLRPDRRSVGVLRPRWRA